RSEEHTSELQSHLNLVCRIIRSEEHTSELQSHLNLVCRLLLEKKNSTEFKARLVDSINHGNMFFLLHLSEVYFINSTVLVFFFNVPATPEIYTLPLHDSLPI